MLKRFGPLVMIGLGAILLLSATAYWIGAQARPTPAALAVPETLAGLKRTGITIGPEAVAEMAQLHGKSLPLTSAAMASYGDSSAALWVSGAQSTESAAEQVRAMTEKIAEGRSPFRPTGARQAAGRTVYALTGMGQQHFYFQSGNLVLWLSADPSVAEDVLGDAMVFYP